MKSLIAALIGCSCAILAHRIAQAGRSYHSWRRDLGTRLIRQLGSRLMKLPWPVLQRYRAHINPLLDENPLPAGLDRELFIGIHAVLGIPLWILTVSWIALPAAVLLVLCLTAGAALPYIWLKGRQKRLHLELLRELPHYVDIQALMLEAGCDLAVGLKHYVHKTLVSPLRDRLAGVERDIRLGQSRIDAFHHLAEKSLFPPLRELCRGIVQGISLGSSLAPLLRDQAAALRIKRMQLAERRAAEAPFKVLLPLFLFIFPTVFLVLLAPLALLLIRGSF